MNFITYFICSLINCMISWDVVGVPHNILRDSKFTWDNMVILSIFAHKGVSHRNSSHNYFYSYKKTPPCLAYFVLSTFGKFTDKFAISIRSVVTFFIRHVLYSHKNVEWKPGSWVALKNVRGRALSCSQYHNKSQS